MALPEIFVAYVDEALAQHWGMVAKYAWGCFSV
jgi:hypothetical protein